VKIESELPGRCCSIKPGKFKFGGNIFVGSYSVFTIDVVLNWVFWCMHRTEIYSIFTSSEIGSELSISCSCIRIPSTVFESNSAAMTNLAVIRVNQTDETGKWFFDS
jgi:hypothetical protein